jgi:hypothetical protein
MLKLDGWEGNKTNISVSRKYGRLLFIDGSLFSSRKKPYFVDVVVLR